ncbi:MAG: SSS family solute:Na+ symporter, partial [Verrucomicrobiales bacterium]
AVYGVLGGITAAYWTDLIQGVCIVLLSILLLPFGLNALVAKFGDPTTMGMLDGFRIMHEQIPASQFAIIGSTSASEFPLYRIAAIVFINIVGAVVMPHFIVTGGGSAKTEFNARVGFVTGNLLKRFCTVGWAITALIALALFADNAELVADPDKVWGMASKELLGPGLLGLMLACLLAALMSSADCYMLVCSGLVVRNIYAAYINDKASDQQYIMLGRIIGMVIILFAVLMSWKMNDVYGQLKLTWIVQVAFAAPFWLGLFWRGATRIGAWCSIAYCALAFFLIPFLAPMVSPELRTSERFTQANEIIVTTETRAAAPSDVRKGAADKVGDDIEITSTSGGILIYFTGALDENGKAGGNFKIDYLLYDLMGVDLRKKSNAMLDTLSLLPKVIVPFLIMILVSLFTKKNSVANLDRYYVKMKTPVIPDPALDHAELEKSYADPRRYDYRKLFKNSSLEIQIPTTEDWLGFVLTVAACFGVIGLILLIAGVGA